MQISPDGRFDLVIATVVTALIGATFLTARPTGYLFWVGGVTVLYLFAARIALAIPSLTFGNGRFEGKPMVGAPLVFSLNDIAEYTLDGMSRPPRAHIVLRNGKRIIIKKPWWSKATSKSEFDAEIRAKAESAA